MGVLKMYPSQRQALEELLDAGDELARLTLPVGGEQGNLCHCATCTAARDWNELRKRHEERIDRLKNRYIQVGNVSN